MNSADIPNAVNGFIWGDYEGLTAEGLFFYGVFSGRSIGRTQSQLDPIFFRCPAYRKKRPPVSICERAPWKCRVPELERNLIKLKCAFEGCRIFDPVPRNCLVKFPCPGCSPNGLCPPPYYIMDFEGLDNSWEIELYDPTGNKVKTQLNNDKGRVVLTFSPEKQFMKADGTLGDYMLVFNMNKNAEKGKEYNVKTNLRASDTPYR